MATAASVTLPPSVYGAMWVTRAILVLFVILVTLGHLVLSAWQDSTHRVACVSHVHSSVLAVCHVEMVQFVLNVQQATPRLIVLFAQLDISFL